MWAMNDADIIQAFGGPTALARSLGLETPDGSRRVHNWIKRGIPARVKVEHRALFDKIVRQASRRHPVTPQEA